MNRSWKSFIIIVSVMLCVIIGCTAWNVALDKITGNIEPGVSQADGTNNSGGDVNGNDLNGTTQSGTETVTNANGQAVTTASGNGSAVVINSNGSKTNASGSGSSSGNSSQQSANILSYNKNQIVAYYNNCLKTTYSQSSFTVTKTEVVDVQVGKLLLNGKETDTIQSMANKIVEKNKKNKTDKKSFTSSNLSDNERFLLPTGLTSAAVKNFTVKKSGSGYVVQFTLNAEHCDYKTKPPYNSSCTYPLDFTEIDLGGLGEITSAEFYYPGTTLTATIDGNGRVVKTYVVMPLTVTNATGSGMGQTITADISGQWLCTNVFSF